MATQFRLVAHASQAGMFEAAAHRTGDGLAQRSLADSRRSDQAHDRRLGLGIEFQDRKLFQDALFDFLQIVMVFIQHLASAGQLEDVGGAFFPGQLQDQLQISPRELVIGGGRRQTLQPAQLPVGFLADRLGQVGLGELPAQFRDFGLLGSAFAQLFLDGAHLLAEHVVALFLAHFRLGAAGDFVPQLLDLDLMRKVIVHQAQRFGLGVRLQQSLLLGRLQAQH